MIPQSKGKIYVAAERGITGAPAAFKTHSTFSFGAYQHAHKTAFEQLYVLNEEVLAPGCSINFNIEEDTTIVLLPLIGAVMYKDDSGNESTITAGALQLFSVNKSTTVKLTNTYDNEAVNFLQLWIKTPQERPATSAQFFIDLDGNINQLPLIMQSKNISIAIGKLEGRQEGIYTVLQRGNAVFAFVIDGQMEVQYRLLQSRDGLGLWALDEVAFEALSATAILLMVEVPVASA